MPPQLDLDSATSSAASSGTWFILAVVVTLAVATLVGMGVHRWHQTRALRRRREQASAELSRRRPMEVLR